MEIHLATTHNPRGECISFNRIQLSRGLIHRMPITCEKPSRRPPVFYPVASLLSRPCAARKEPSSLRLQPRPRPHRALLCLARCCLCAAFLNTCLESLHLPRSRAHSGQLGARSERQPNAQPRSLRYTRYLLIFRATGRNLAEKLLILFDLHARTCRSDKSRGKQAKVCFQLDF